MEKRIYVTIPGLNTTCLSLQDGMTAEQQIYDYMFAKYSLPNCDYWIDDTFSGNLCYHLRFRLLGGKGGFGSNLRAQGNKMSAKRRAVSQESCRDLAGQRLRTVTETRLINDYLIRKPDMERRKEEKRKEKMLKIIENSDRKPSIDDAEYMKVAKEAAESVESAVYAALLGSETSEDESAEPTEKKENENEDNN